MRRYQLAGAKFIRRAAIMLPLVVLSALAPAKAQPVPTPNFVDQRQTGARPPSPELARLRFLTSVDYPPFNFLDARGRLTGFHVELARLLCEELGMLDICQIEARPFEDLLPALDAGEGEAIVAGLAITAENRERAAFTRSFFRYPARFLARTDTPFATAPESHLAGARVGVVAGTAHAAMLTAFFPQAEAVSFPGRDAALEALKGEEIDALFGDGVWLSFWQSGEAAEDCCVFAGGPYFSDHFLGEGLAIAVAPRNTALAKAFDDALTRLVESGRYSELLLRFFPVSAF